MDGGQALKELAIGGGEAVVRFVCAARHVSGVSRFGGNEAVPRPQGIAADLGKGVHLQDLNGWSEVGCTLEA